MDSVAPGLANLSNQSFPLSTSKLSNSNNNYSGSNDYSSGGIKRKHSEIEADDKWSERQSILNMSMSKLQPPQGKGEASLRRSVLIFNTLRYLEQDLQNNTTMPITNLPIPPKDICLDPGHKEEVLEQINPCNTINSHVQQKYSEKSSEHFHESSAVSSSSSPSSYTLHSSLSTSSSFVATNSCQTSVQQQSLSSSSVPSSVPSTPSSSVYNSMDYNHYTSMTQPCQNSEQFLQDTTYILDSLLSSERVSSLGSILPQTHVEPVWEEPDNMWLSKYDEPFTNWLLNDDLDHIMQIIVGGSAG